MTELTDEQLIILVVILIAGYFLYNRYEGFNIGGRYGRGWMREGGYNRRHGRYYYPTRFVDRPWHHKVFEYAGYGYPESYYLPTYEREYPQSGYWY